MSRVVMIVIEMCTVLLALLLAYLQLVGKLEGTFFQEFLLANLFFAAGGVFHLGAEALRKRQTS